MDFHLFAAALLGVVEGITEFLPISSTGHLIIAGDLLNFTGEKEKTFSIVIQLAAILAVCWEYRAKLVHVVGGLASDPQSRRFAVNLIIGFLPSAVLGLAFYKVIKGVLFHPVPVATALVIGGIIILIIERRPRVARVHSVDSMTAVDALKVGFCQALAMIPGTSRAGATIIGGMLCGLSRQTATEFSFFLAIPTMLSATVYDVYKNRALFSSSDIPMFSIGFLAAFVAAFLTVRGLLKYLARHDFTAFGWYRIVFGGIVLLSWWFGWANWSS